MWQLFIKVTNFHQNDGLLSNWLMFIKVKIFHPSEEFSSKVSIFIYFLSLNHPSILASTSILAELGPTQPQLVPYLFIWFHVLFVCLLTVMRRAGDIAFLYLWYEKGSFFVSANSHLKSNLLNDGIQTAVYASLANLNRKIFQFKHQIHKEQAWEAISSGIV